MARMPVSRRLFLGGVTAGAAARVSAAAGLKPSDLPDLTIKEVKVYVTDHGRLASVVTKGGIEGNYSLGHRYWHPDWNNAGWVEFAKQALVGRSALERPALTSQWDPPKRRRGQSSYASASEVCKAVRKAAGDDFALLMDPVGVYSRQEALAVGRLLDELKFVAFEDPIPTKDTEGLVELCRALDVPIHAGEFIFSLYDYAEYIRRGAMDVVRFIVDNIGGITGAMKIANLAECFGMECAPHNWGDTLDYAVHFHCELAMPNNVWFEMTVPQGVYASPYMRDQIRIAADGYVHAPVKPGLGYEIDHNILDNLTKRIER